MLKKKFQFAVIISISILSSSVEAGLVAYYTFNETSGTIAHNSIGSVNGILQGGATFMPRAGIRGGAIKLDKATGDFVDMGDHFGFTSGSFSIQAWVKLNAGDTDYSVPIAKHWGGIAAGYFLAINDVSDGCSAIGKAHFYVGYPCSGVSSKPINDGLWHQLVGVYDSTKQMASIYVDGQFQSSSSGGNIVGATAAPFLVGGLTGGSAVYTGLIDEVRIYNNALSAATVQQLYYQIIPPQISGKATWKTNHTVTCQNITRGTELQLPITKGDNWNCETAGLKFKSGDTVRVIIDGKRY